MFRKQPRARPGGTQDNACLAARLLCPCCQEQLDVDSLKPTPAGPPTSRFPSRHCWGENQPQARWGSPLHEDRQTAGGTRGQRVCWPGDPFTSEARRSQKLLQSPRKTERVQSGAQGGPGAPWVSPGPRTMAAETLALLILPSVTSSSFVALCLPLPPFPSVVLPAQQPVSPLSPFTPLPLSSPASPSLLHTCTHSHVHIIPSPSEC